MRIGVVCYCNGDSKILDYSQALVRGIEKQGMHAEIVNIDKDPEKKLTIYNYLIIGTGAVSAFSGKIPVKIEKYLKNCGSVSGKRCVAFTNKKGLFSSKIVLNLMKSMEKEGMFIKNSFVVRSANEAEAIAERLKIK